MPERPVRPRREPGSRIMDASRFNRNTLLVRKLESISALCEDERLALQNLPMQVQDLRPDQDIVREGDRPSRSCLVLDGFAATYKMTGDGKRQIMAFHSPGDIPDLQSFQLKVLDSSLGTLTACKVGSSSTRSCATCAVAIPASTTPSGARR